VWSTEPLWHQDGAYAKVLQNEASPQCSRKCETTCWNKFARRELRYV
jgi:hypothetical protein